MAQYRQLAYIEFSGTQKIDTGVHEDATYAIDMQSTRATSKTQVVLSNNVYGTNSKWFGTSANNNYYSIGNPGVSSVVATNRKTVVVTFTNMYSLTSGSSSFYFKDNPGTVYTKNYNPGASTTFTNIVVGTNANEYPSYFKLFSLPIYNTSNVLIRDYIPVLDSLGIPCLYDRVNGTLTYNSGTGSFTYAEIDYNKKLQRKGLALLTGLDGYSLYTPVKYLKSNSSQYINTGVAGGSDTQEIDIVFKYTTYVAWGAIFANNVADSYNGVRLLCYPSSGQLCSNLNTICGTQGNQYFNCSLNAIHHMIIRKSEIITDGVSTTRTKLTQGTDNTTNICLFNRSITNPATGRDIGLSVYQFKVRNNGELQCDLVPVIRNSDGKPGMYDRVTGNFRTNIGTGEFTYG